MISWLLVGIIIATTTIGDLLQSMEMKRQGPIEDFDPRGVKVKLAQLARRPFLLWAVFCMAISFFSFMLLLSVADLSFAVPATAGSFVIETIFARVLLKEHVGYLRWTGALLVAGGVALLV